MCIFFAIFTILFNHKIKITTMEKKGLLATALGIGLSLGLLYAFVYVGSKAWNKGKTA